MKLHEPQTQRRAALGALGSSSGSRTAVRMAMPGAGLSSGCLTLPGRGCGHTEPHSAQPSPGAASIDEGRSTERHGRGTGQRGRGGGLWALPHYGALRLEKGRGVVLGTCLSAEQGVRQEDRGHNVGDVARGHGRGLGVRCRRRGTADGIR